MKKSALIYFCVLLSGILMFSCKPKDRDLQKAVQTALLDSPTGIESTVKGGVVTLTGVVDSEEAKVAAEEAAKRVKDVKSVVNNIKVKTPAPSVVVSADDVLRASISASIADGGFKGILVEVKDSVVTLTGSVKKADLTRVMQIANEAKPLKVVNELKIDK